MEASFCKDCIFLCALVLCFGLILSSEILGWSCFEGFGNAFFFSTAKAVDHDIGDREVEKMALAKNLAIVVEEASNGDRTSKATLAESLAALVEESSIVKDRKPRSRMELKRFLELQIKRRVKEQQFDGKFHNLMAKVVSTPQTLQNAYDCLRVNSNVDLASERDNLDFESLAEELLCGKFDMTANTYSISTRGSKKEVLVLPTLKLKVVQEAIRIALEVVYKPHFLKVSHGCRSGRNHLTALRYICKEITDPDWFFTIQISKKLDSDMLSKLITTMENKINDPQLYSIIQCMFHAQVLNLEFGGFPKGHGLPQEGVLSSILMNIYLDLFDSEIYRISMRYEALGQELSTGPNSNLRSWFRRQINEKNVENCTIPNSSRIRLNCCRFMDEILVAISGPKEIALASKSDMEQFLQNTLLLEVDDHKEIIPSCSHKAARFVGTSLKRSLKQSPALRAVHKLKEKVKLFASQKQEAWEAGTVRIGRQWLAHGLKKVKESEIKHLADTESVLTKISRFRKDGMRTDHWYKELIKVWMQHVNAKDAENEDLLLSKHVVEPSLPRELRESYYEFQKRAEEYVSSETVSVLALLPNSSSLSEPIYITEAVAPVDAIKKRLYRYGMTNSVGFPHPCHVLVLMDDSDIIDWFSGLVCRWLRWYRGFSNFDEIKLIIFHQVRMSCIRTLAVKYRIHETDIEKKFDIELSRIPAALETENEIAYEASLSQAFGNEDSLMYGITNSGLCLLSLTRKVSHSRPCSCFAMGCKAAAPYVYTLHVMERQKFPGWKTGFASCIHPSLNRRRIGLCKTHLRDLFLGHISLQSINFGAWR